MLINAGIRKVVYLEGYSDNLSVEMLDEAGIETLSFAEVIGKLPGEGS
jgi:dCMP deaminase